MLVMMWAERGTKYITDTDYRRVYRSCRGLVNGLGTPDIDTDVDDSKASPPHPPHVCLVSKEGASEEGCNKDQDYQLWRTTFFLFFFGCVDITGCVLSEVPFPICLCPLSLPGLRSLLAHQQGAKREPWSIQTLLGRTLDSLLVTENARSNLGSQSDKIHTIWVILNSIQHFTDGIAQLRLSFLPLARRTQAHLHGAFSAARADLTELMFCVLFFIHFPSANQSPSVCSTNLSFESAQTAKSMAPMAGATLPSRILYTATR
jgi:hypothetical protein